MDYFLKADSESALMTALEAAGVVESIEVKNEQGEVVETRFVPNTGYNLDIIGIIYKPTGNIKQETVGDTTVDIPEMEALPGFHANLRGPADLAAKVTITEYQPTPAELATPGFVKPEPTRTETPSPLQALLVFPQNPVRVWF